MRYLFILLLIFSFVEQLQSQTIAEIVNRFKTAKELEFEDVGLASTKSELYQDFLKLVRLANAGTLIKLTKHESPIVRCYAGWGIIDKKYPNLAEVYVSFLENDINVDYATLDMGDRDKISSLFYHRYWNKIDYKKKATDKILFTLDSISLYNPHSNWLLITRALENRIYPYSFNKQIEYLAFNKKEQSALFYLSNWFKAFYVNRLKAAFISYLNTTSFKNVGADIYYNVVNELLKFKDVNINKIIIKKLQRDKHWECDKKRFEDLLSNYGIYEYD